MKLANGVRVIDGDLGKWATSEDEFDAAAPIRPRGAKSATGQIPLEEIRRIAISSTSRRRFDVPRADPRSEDSTTG